MNRKPGPVSRQRAKRACRTCNARRVKCNVTEQQPCRNCALAAVPCELIESRRGKHPRQKKRPAATSTVPSLDLSLGSITSIEASSDPYHIGPRRYSLLDNAQPVPSPNLYDGRPSSPGTVNLQSNSPPDSLHDSVYLGESTLLTCIQAGDEPLDSMDTTDHRLFHSVSKPPEEGPTTNVGGEALATPTKSVRDILVHAYFQWFHPSFPIIDQCAFLTQDREGSLSPLLLHAVSFIGATHCEEKRLQDAGYADRHYAKKLFYNRAKSIYDADKELDFLKIIQAVFLLSFWRGGPFEKKDTRHWLGIAISMCQTKALHRKGVGKDTQLDRMKRRIWWSLYIRERQCASALGLPIRIRDEDCDVEKLVMDDFFDEIRPSIQVSTKLTTQHVDYVIQSCTLSKFLGDIVYSTYLPNQKPDALCSSKILDQLHAWKDGLPQTMRTEQDSNGDLDFYPALLQMAYNNLIILVYRSAFLKDMHEDGPKAVIQAACRNSRLLEDLMANDSLHHGQLHLVTIIFNTLCIHTIICNRSIGVTKSLAEQRAHLCLIGLKELGKRWEIRNWILDLFLHYLDRSPLRRLRLQGTSDPSQGAKPAMDSTHISLHDDQTTAANSLVALHQSTTPTANTNVEPGRDMLADMQNYQPSNNVDDILMNQIENDFLFGEGNGLSYESTDMDILTLLGLNAFSPSGPELVL